MSWKQTSRDARQGTLVRAGRGLYAAQVRNSQGVRPPYVGEVVKGLVSHGLEITESGAAAANALGLTTQVPIREAFLTSGPTSRVKVGRQVAELRHAPGWQLLFPGKPAGSVIRAIAWLGPERSEEVVAAARERLSKKEIKGTPGCTHAHSDVGGTHCQRLGSQQ